MSISSKTSLSNFLQDRRDSISIVDVLISNVIIVCYTTSPTQYLRLHYRDVPFIAFWSWLALRSIAGDRLDDTEFGTFVNASMATNASCGMPLHASCANSLINCVKLFIIGA